MTPKGSAAEGILLKMLLQNGIEAEHGSPSSPGDIIVPPNVIIEIKDTKSGSFSFKQAHKAGQLMSRSERQWNALNEKKERFPWLEIFYVVRFHRKEWRYFHFPDEPSPLRLKEGGEIGALLHLILERQSHLMDVMRPELPQAEVIGTNGRATMNSPETRQQKTNSKRTQDKLQKVKN